MTISERIQLFKEDKYHYSVDILRGIAALMVVVYHFVLGNPNRFHDFKWLKVFAMHGHLGVQIFFVISGFVIPNAMKAGKYEPRYFGKFMLKRLARLEPPYILSIALCLFLIYISQLNPYSRTEGVSITWPQVLFHLGYLNSFLHYDWLNVVYWTLAIEFQYYLIMALIYPVIDSEKKYLKLFVLAAFYTLPILFDQKEFIFRHAPYFLFGVFLFMFKWNKINRVELLLLFLLNFTFLFFNDPLPYLIFSVFAFLFILFSRSENSIGKYLGTVSYSLYLLHVPIGQRLLNFSENFTDQEIFRLGIVIAVTVLMIFISRVYYLLIERPSQNLSKRIVFVRK